MQERFLQTLIVRVEGPVATISLNRGEALNALNAQMFDELEEVFTEFEKSSDIRVVVVTGAGARAFAAGADIRELVNTDEISGLAVSLRGQSVFRQIETSSKPVIAAINGAALGGGCELALACSVRIASDTAKIGLPEVKLGLIPGYGGTQRLPRLIGRGAALRMMLSAEIISAAEAKLLGLVDEVVPPEALSARCAEFATRIATMAPLAIEGILSSTKQSTIESEQDGMRLEAGIFAHLCATQDKREGLNAFLEKREPHWTGA